MQRRRSHQPEVISHERCPHHPRRIGVDPRRAQHQRVPRRRLRVVRSAAGLHRGRRPVPARDPRAAVDEVHVNDIRATSHVVERTTELIARGDRSYFKVSLMLAGTGLLIQDDREAVLQPGDLAVYDTDRPYSLVFDQDFRTMVVMFPKHLISLPADMIGQLDGRPHLRAGGAGRHGRAVPDAARRKPRRAGRHDGGPARAQRPRPRDHRVHAGARTRPGLRRPAPRPHAADPFAHRPQPRLHRPRSGLHRRGALHLHPPPARAVPGAGGDRVDVD
ncbi:hypothetical protein CTI14_29150, partial [Methylobacterium radiotolerans]